MITHEQLILAIQTKYPQLVHGRDYLVAHPIETTTGEQKGDAYILRWASTEVEQPDLQVMLRAASDLLPTFLAGQARLKRDQMLVQCDWTQTMDAPLTGEQKNAWAEYRTALRNLPAQAGFPTAIVWPTIPEQK